MSKPEMSAQELAERCKKLDRLYLSADNARSAWLTNPTSVNLRRLRYYALKYERFVAEADHMQEEQ